MLSNVLEISLECVLKTYAIKKINSGQQSSINIYIRLILASTICLAMYLLSKTEYKL